MAARRTVPELTDIPVDSALAPVVLLPGMIAGAWMWASTPALLSDARRRTLVFRDAIGLVASTIDEYTDFVVERLAQLSLPPIVMIGASLGSAVALTYAARHPERVKALVISGAPTMTGAAQLGITSFGKLTRGVAEAAADRLFFDRSRLDDAFVEQTFQAFLDKRCFINVVKLMRESSLFDTLAPLRHIDVDTLMVWGEDDRISRLEDWLRIAPYVKRGTLVTIPRCGHSPMLEQPDAFNSALFDFLSVRVV